MMMLEKVKMKKGTLKTAAPRGDAGFTAVEIAMVAAVIAILSLIVLPIFRNRVEDAKVAAAQADLRALMLAQQVVQADTDVFARLEDLDNVQLFGYLTNPAGGVDKEVPFFKYIKPTPGVTPPETRRVMLDNAERVRFAGTEQNPIWRGPYIAFQRSITYENLLANGLADVLLASINVSYRAAIQDVSDNGFNDHVDNRYPVDPWGNPYMFFAPTGNSADPAVTDEFPTSAIYCLGPNGLAGDGSRPVDANAYTREGAAASAPTDFGVIGKDDDLMVEF